MHQAVKTSYRMEITLAALLMTTLMAVVVSLVEVLG